jgi:hypothetical protein
MQNGSPAPDAPSASTQLVALAAGSEARAAPVPRPLAGFVAQLLACRDQLPAYRARRRAAPERAIACYRESPSALPGNGYERRF